MKRFIPVLLLLSLLAVSPRVLAGGTVVCSACTVPYGQWKSHTQSAQSGHTHEIRLTILSGTASLTVYGSPVSGLTCSASGNVRTCTFVASLSGNFNVVVYGAPGPANYRLEHYWND